MLFSIRAHPLMSSLPAFGFGPHPMPWKLSAAVHSVVGCLPYPGRLVYQRWFRDELCYAGLWTNRVRVSVSWRGWHDGIDIGACVWHADLFAGTGWFRSSQPATRIIIATIKAFGKYVADKRSGDQDLVLWFAHLGEIDVVLGQSVVKERYYGLVGDDRTRDRNPPPLFNFPGQRFYDDAA